MLKLVASNGELVKDQMIFKAADGFNHVAAQKFYDLVMKMDDDEAFTFMEFTLANILEEDISKNLRTYQRRVDEVIEKRMTDLKKATIRSVSKADSDDVVAFSQAISVIDKALEQSDLAHFNDLHPRGVGGRFKVKVSSTGKMKLHDREAESMGLPGKKHTAGLSATQKAHYHEQYAQLGQFLDTVNSSFRNPGDADVFAHIQNRKNKKIYTVRINGLKPNTWDPHQEDLVGLEARPNTLTAGGAYFNLSSALGADGIHSANASRKINATDQNASSWTNDWLGAGDDKNSNAKTYSRIATGGKVMSDLSIPGSKAHAAGRMAQFIGEHGHEAEAVIGPHARKTAYRYRGTSKKPDANLSRQVDSAINRAKLQEDMARGTYKVVNGERVYSKNPRQLSPVQQAAARITAERREPTFEEQQAGTSVAISYMKRRVPKGNLYNLHLAAGHTPPSEGVILDKTGKVVDQAIGYGDDHYLPFNLKNLGKLKGGTYVRTRSVGGLTSEDIYTGLMAGARQVVVTSRSGTFTMTFDQDFKGTRRYNDKALRMTRRYEQLLDAVQSEQVDKEHVDERVRMAITQQVKGEMGHLGLSNADLRKEIDNRVQAYKADPEMSDSDDQIAWIIASHDARAAGSRDTDAYVRQVKAELAQQKELTYRLNGTGYAAAQEALAQQFPYYITTSADVEENTERKSAKDRGYVEPGRNRPTAARAGMFGTGVNPGAGKFSASQADYQGAREAKRISRGTLTPREEAPAEEKTEAKPEAKKSPVDEYREQKRASDAAVALHSELKDREPENLNLPWQKMSQGEFANWIKSPQNLATFDRHVMQRERDLQAMSGEQRNAFGNVPNLINDYKVATGKVGNKDYDPDLVGTWTDSPMNFGDNKAYSPDATPEQRAEEMKRIKGDRMGVVTRRPLSQMSDEELRDEINKVSEIHDLIDRYPNLAGEDRAKLAHGVPRSDELNHVMTNSKNARDHLEAVQRVRTLNHGVTDRRSEVKHNPPKKDTFEETIPRNLASYATDLRRAMEDDPNADPNELRKVQAAERDIEDKFGPDFTTEGYAHSNRDHYSAIMRNLHKYGL